MNTKYEFSGETKVVFGVVLKRIRALVSFKFVKKGDLGGWIENEENLSPEGNAWVYGNAKVCGNAEVYGNAEVCGDAEVYGNAEVCGDAFIASSKQLFVVGAIGSRNGFTSFFLNKKKEIKIKCGCFFGNSEEFLAKVEKTHGDNKYGRNYRLALELAKSVLDTSDD